MCSFVTVLIAEVFFFVGHRSPPREGAYVNGLFMEGARWDTVNGSIADSLQKELFPAMPVIFIKAVTQDKQDVKNIYECPVYKIRWVVARMNIILGLIFTCNYF